MHRSCIDAILEPMRSYLRYGRNGPCFVRFRGRLTLQTLRNVEERSEERRVGTEKRVPSLHWGSTIQWPSPCVCEARPWPTLNGRAPLLGARGSARLRRYAGLSVFLWFSGLFSKHRSPMKVILEPMRSYLRYEHNGSCFVGFRGRLTLQTLRNVEESQGNGLSGTQKGVPSLHWGSAIQWPSPCVCEARPWPTLNGRAPLLGARGSARLCRFVSLFFLFDCSFVVVLEILF